MRRFVLILLLTFLPLQWSWTAVASICQHEAGRTEQHLGHHDHEHANAEIPAQGATADNAADPSSDDGVLKAKTSVDKDCHGHGFTALMGTLTSPVFWGGGTGLSVYHCQIPDRSPDRLLRPPSSHLA
jgi:hypothetical protein